MTLKHAHANVDQFSRVAASYDRPMLRRFFRRTHEATLEGIDVRGKRCLDAGGGTGELARLLRERGAALSVVADLALPMAAVARGKGLPAAAADATRLPFRDGAFALAFTTNSLHHWDPWPLGVAEMRRVVAPGGLVVVEDFASHGLGNRVVNGLARAFEPSHVGFLSVHDLGGAMRAAGLADVVVRVARGPLRLNLLVATGRVSA
ncbi:MAG TPA: class I SAM-dependent methyltransferase [Candidatus Thermoplasmatota archaeon]|nr:class I SAM-dependent methyltransferase [Candidatus Thermoplasmatota archaeon]